MSNPIHWSNSRINVGTRGGLEHILDINKLADFDSSAEESLNSGSPQALSFLLL